MKYKSIRQNGIIFIRFFIIFLMLHHKISGLLFEVYADDELIAVVKAMQCFAKSISFNFLIFFQRYEVLFRHLFLMQSNGTRIGRVNLLRTCYVRILRCICCRMRTIKQK